MKKKELLIVITLYERVEGEADTRILKMDACGNHENSFGNVTHTGGQFDMGT